MIRKTFIACVQALFLIAWCHFAVAQSNVIGGGVFGDVKPPVSYVGPCDVSGVTCVGYFSAFGCAQAAYAGNVIDVVDVATGNTTGTRLQCSNGVVSALVSGSACTFVTGNACSTLATTCAVSCTFSTVYNQMGTGTISNATLPAALANRSPLALNALNSKPCFSNASTGLRVESTSTFSLAQPLTLAAVSKRTGGTAANGRIISDTLATITLNYRSSVNTLGSQAGTITETASDNAFHGVMLVTASGTGNSFLVVDGTPSTTGTLSTSFSATNLFMLGDNAANDMIGVSCESIITSNALNSTQYAALNSNFRLSNRWGNSF